MSDPTPLLKGVTPHLLFAIIASTAGSGFQHGYHTGVINAPELLLKEFINDTFYYQYKEYPGDYLVTVIFSVMVSIFSLGGMVGGFLTSILSETYGCKSGLLFSTVLVFVSCALMGFSKMANNFLMLIFGRFTIGINCGLGAGLAPMYLTEISPIHLRGAIGTIYQFFIVLSILVSQICGLPAVLGTEERWPILFGVCIIPTIFMLVTLPFCPDSPRYILIIQKEDEKAMEALAWFRQKDVALEMDEMKAEREEIESMPKVTLKDICMNKELRKPLTVGSVIMICQQFSGINAIIYYSTSIFMTAGLKRGDAIYATVGIGVINMISTIVAVVLVEKAGRKILLIFGLSGMMVVTLLITVCIAYLGVAVWLSYLCIALVLIFIVLFAVGLGPIPWFLVNEFFTQRARPVATGFAVAVNWISNFIVGLCFLPIKDLIHHFVFLIFTFFLALFTTFTFLEVPETKGRKIEDIMQEWK